jgi:hypothetical protein
MKVLLALLLAISMSLSAYASAANIRVCCASEKCDIVQCADMGCVPSAAAMLPTPLLEWRFLAGVSDPQLESAPFLPNYFKDIWTPPD